MPIYIPSWAIEVPCWLAGTTLVDCLAQARQRPADDGITRSIRSDRPAIKCTSWSSSAPLPHLDIGNGFTSKPQDLSEARSVPGLSAGVAPGHRGPVPDPFRHQDRVSNYLVILPLFASYKYSSLTVPIHTDMSLLGKIRCPEVCDC